MCVYSGSCCRDGAEDGDSRWVLVVRLFYGEELGASWQYRVQLSHSMAWKILVRATSFILLLGVGSFVCYRLFHQLKRRLAKGSKRSSQPRAPPAKLRKLSYTHKRYLDCLLCDHEDLSSLSNSDFSDTSSCSSYGGRESTSDSPSLSDGDSDSVIMGVTTSNPLEPVYFSKASGIHFRGDQQNICTSTPLDQLTRNIERRNSPRKRHLHANNEIYSDHKENVFTESGSFHVSGSYQDLENSSQMDSISYEGPSFSPDAASMHGNFSPGSLRERTRKTEQLLSSKLDKPNSLLLKRDFSVDSFTYNSEQEYDGPVSKRSVSRTLSIDSEVSELCIELQRDAEEAHEMGIVTVEKMETLEDEINDIKQTVLELDADLVGLKIYKRPPANCWELTNISESEKSTNSEISNSGLVDVIHHHKNKMWCKGFLDVDKLKVTNSKSTSVQNADVIQSPQWDQVCNQMLDWDVSVDNPFDIDQVGGTDSGSDFGNSLETDSVDIESMSVNGAASNSLEWDTNFISEFGIHGTDEIDSAVKQHKLQSSSKSTSRKSLTHQSKSLHDEFGHRNTFKKKHRSQSIPEVLSEQIQGALRKRTPLCSLVSQMDLGLTPLSSQLPSPMSEVKTESSQMPEIYASLQSNLTSSSAAAFKSFTSHDESGFLETKRTDSDIVLGSNFHETKGNHISQESNGNFPSSVVKNVNRDSAYCEGSDFPEVASVENVGPELGVEEYSQRQESQENVKRSQLIKKAYSAVQEKLGITNIRSIRADNYSVIRATLYQLLSTGLPILQHYGGAAAVYQVLSKWATDANPWLLDWTFAHSLPYNNNSCLQGFWDCLQALENMESSLKEVVDRGQHLALILNRNPDLDVQLLEAVKLLMCISAFRLYSGEDLMSSTVPVFVMLLFARDESPTPKELVLNRLNRVGHDKRLEQVEIYLLGYSLSVTLRVVNFQHFGSQEFITYYPDCNLGSWKESTLIAEDHQHFNVVTR